MRVGALEIGANQKHYDIEHLASGWNSDSYASLHDLVGFLVSLVLGEMRGGEVSYEPERWCHQPTPKCHFLHGIANLCKLLVKHGLC